MSVFRVYDVGCLRYRHAATSAQTLRDDMPHDIGYKTLCDEMALKFSCSNAKDNCDLMHSRTCFENHAMIGHDLGDGNARP